jgi:hypothetical protein
LALKLLNLPTDNLPKMLLHIEGVAGTTKGEKNKDGTEKAIDRRPDEMVSRFYQPIAGSYDSR